MASLEQEIGELLRRKGLTLGAVESATGGLISHLITNVPGSSDYYKGSVTAYSNETKIKVVGVKRDTIEKYGAVSPQVAEEMARGAGRCWRWIYAWRIPVLPGRPGLPRGSRWGFSTSGWPIGTAPSAGGTSFHGDREQNKRSAAEAALSWLKEYLLGLV